MFCSFFKWLSNLFGCDGCVGVKPLQILNLTPGFVIGGSMDLAVISGGAAVILGLQLAPDASGNPTTVLPGPVVWTIDNSAAATLTPSTDGLTVSVVGAAVGSFVVTATTGGLAATINGTTTAGVTTGISIVVEPADPAVGS